MLDGFAEQTLSLVAVEIRVVVDFPFEILRQAFEVEGRAYLLLVEEIERFVGGDAVQPGVELGIASESRQGVPHLDIYILDEIIGIFMGTDKGADMPVQAFAIGLHYLIESFLLTSRTIKLQNLLVSHEFLP